MKYLLILFLFCLFSCDDKVDLTSNNDPDLKNAHDSTSLINIEVDSSFRDTVVIELKEDTIIFGLQID